MENSELKALISLLDDTDPVVFDQIQSRLITLGKDVIPVLEDVWGKSFDAELQSRIENIIHKIQFETEKENLRKWNSSTQNDLLEGLILVARYQYPDLDTGKVYDLLERLKEGAVTETQMHHSPLEKTYALNRIMFDIFGFRGNTANFHSPQNSCINTVLETRKGNPLLLCSIYSMVAQHAGMPVFGVNLPEHFVLAYKEKNIVQMYEYTYPEANILFYINGFSRGTIFMKSDINNFLTKLKLEPAKNFFEPCSNKEIVKRALRNLAVAYHKTGDAEKSNEVDELLNCVSEK